MALKDFLRGQVERSPTARRIQSFVNRGDPRLKPILSKLDENKKRELQEKMENLQKIDDKAYEKALEVILKEKADCLQVAKAFNAVAKVINKSFGNLRIRGTRAEKDLLESTSALFEIPATFHREATENYVSIISNAKDVKVVAWMAKLKERESVKVPIILKWVSAILANENYDGEFDGYLTGALLQAVEDIFSKGGSDSNIVSQTTERASNIIANSIRRAENPSVKIKEVANKLRKYGGQPNRLVDFVKSQV